MNWGVLTLCNLSLFFFFEKTQYYCNKQGCSLSRATNISYFSHHLWRLPFLIYHKIPLTSVEGDVTFTETHQRYKKPLCITEVLGHCHGDFAEGYWTYIYAVWDHPFEKICSRKLDHNHLPQFPGWNKIYVELPPARYDNFIFKTFRLGAFCWSFLNSYLSQLDIP